MGTEIGVKGKGLHPNMPQRIATILELCAQSGRRPEIVVDGGIRRETVPLLAQAGADGVVPGSLVFGEPDPCAALRWIHDSVSIATKNLAPSEPASSGSEEILHSATVGDFMRSHQNHNRLTPP